MLLLTACTALQKKEKQPLKKKQVNIHIFFKALKRHYHPPQSSAALDHTTLFPTISPPMDRFAKSTTQVFSVIRTPPTEEQKRSHKAMGATGKILHNTRIDKTIETLEGFPEKQALYMWCGAKIWHCTYDKGVVRFAVEYRHQGRQKRQGIVLCATEDCARTLARYPFMWEAAATQAPRHQ